MDEALRNPCRDCHLEEADKNNPECLGCQDRMDYTRKLGSMSYGVPEHLSGLVGREENQSMEDSASSTTAHKDSAPGSVETKICIQPECAKAGQPQPKVTAFYPSDPRCKKCRHKIQAAQKWLKGHLSEEAYEEVKKNRNYLEVYKRRLEDGETQPSRKPTEKIKAEQPRTESPPVFDLTTTAVDFTKEFKDLYSEVVGLAKTEMRPVDFQIAYLIRLGLESCRQDKGS